VDLGLEGLGLLCFWRLYREQYGYLVHFPHVSLARSIALPTGIVLWFMSVLCVFLV
jgi:hypothetical protein